MALKSPEGFDQARLREQVEATYQKVATNPDGDFHFHRGAEYAVEYLKYDMDELASLPIVSTARFAGVGNPHRIGPIDPGEAVVDHACGAGMDLLLAAKRVSQEGNKEGRAIGVDMTAGMRECAQKGAEEAGLSDIVDIRDGVFEKLPVDSESVDVVISNGVLNLAPDKALVFEEIMRVLVPGGRLYLADVVVQRELTLEARSDPEIWAACIGGALPEYELIEAAEMFGFEAGEITERFDCFKNTSAEEHVSKDLYVMGVNFFAQKPHLAA